MDAIIITRFHHGGKFIQDKTGITYKGEAEVEYVNIDKDHFSIIELLFYTKQLGYITVGGFCVKDPTKNDFIEVDTDLTLVNLIKDLKDGDFLDIYVKYVVDDLEVVTTGLLCGSVVEEDLEDINVTASEGLNHEAESENVNVEVEPGDISDLDVEWTESNEESSDDSQEDAIPDVDDSEVDEELRSLRNERRNKVKKKKPTQTEEIKLGTAGVDRGFEDIGRNKAARYTGRLGGDEQYIDSSELDSEDSRVELDSEFVKGVDLPRRRKSKKVRFDPDCVVAIFELGMVFESAEQFRKAIADYSCQYKTRLKLKPNDKKRVRVKCEDKKCKWLLFASIDKDSGDFVVKNYYPVHVCPQSTKNKLCTSKFVAEKFKDEITCQPYIRLWEIQELVRKKLKRGWLEGCRKIIGFDGCFLKGSCKGELLVAVGRNGNQQMFPIAWAVVDTETKHSWSFFLKYLIEDLNLGRGHGLTVMSDMQKVRWFLHCILFYYSFSCVANTF
ncbi:uncharacterized protein [Solanum lycopersicum]|uniref:uncharacterized protein n=1 Tax=Solanum lycopersicum TaxID=4081 RepID=UPI0037489B8E